MSEHVTSRKTYFLIYAALIVLTARQQLWPMLISAHSTFTLR